MTNPTIDHLLTRRSVSANSLGEPGPSESEIAQMLGAAARVPDHKKLVPWRFLLFQGEGRAAFGKILAEICKAEEKDPSAFRLETEANRFMRAPLVIAVVWTIPTFGLLISSFRPAELIRTTGWWTIFQNWGLTLDKLALRARKGV